MTAIRKPVAHVENTHKESAGCFALLRERDAVRVDVPRPVDVSPECCTMLEKLMLAQAQECFFEKATRDNKSPGIVARCV